MIEQAKELMARGWNAIRFFPAGARRRAASSSRASRSPTTATWLVKAREALGRRGRARHRLPPPPVSVAEAASFCQKMPSGTLDFLEEPIRDETPEAYESLRTHDRRALRHRRGVRLASGSSCPTSSAASTSSTGSTSATSAA